MGCKVQWSIPYVESTSNHGTSLSSIWQQQVLRCLMWCVRYWSWLCTDARQSGDCIRVPSSSATWAKLSHSWSWASSGYSYSQDLETLSYGHSLQYLYWPWESQIYFHPKWAKYEVTKMAGINQRLWPGSTLSSGQSQCRSQCAQSQGSLQFPFSGIV